MVANLSRRGDCVGNAAAGHIMKGRYLPCQVAVRTLEEAPVHADVWNRSLGGFPVLVAQLHSQIAPALAGLKAVGRERLAYIMTDCAALPIAYSRLVRTLKNAGWLGQTITCGQAFGGDYETVTLHSALLASRHILGCDAAVVCQGPGNAGTATRLGFSGIEQAQNLDIVSALGGLPIAVLRMSSADNRPRHRGLSHHSQTVLGFTHAKCVVAVPEGQPLDGIPYRHDVRIVAGADRAVRALELAGIEVKSMGRSPADDPLFFNAAAAAGLAVKPEEGTEYDSVTAGV